MAQLLSALARYNDPGDSHQCEQVSQQPAHGRGFSGHNIGHRRLSELFLVTA